MSKNVKKKTAAVRVPKATPSTASVESADKPTYQERMRKLSPHARVQTKLTSTVERFKYIVAEIATWQNAGDELTSCSAAALSAIEETLDLVNSLPKGFVADKPRKASRSSLETGARVNLREKHFETYEGIIDGKDRIKLEVLDTRKGRVVCRTQSGEKVIIPRGHVELVPSDKPAARSNKAA